jgi:hypothetical protein
MADMADMADSIDLMLATGGRIGEMLALRWADVALDAARPNVTMSGTIKTEPRKGTYRKGQPEVGLQRENGCTPGARHRRFSSAVERQRARIRTTPFFPTRNGTWQQVNKVERRWPQIRKDTGLDWVTPHTFRKTVATLISERSPPRPPPNSSATPPPPSPAITREFYISKPAIAADVAHVLEELAAADPPTDRRDTSGISGEWRLRVQMQNRLRPSVSAGQSRLDRSG